MSEQGQVVLSWRRSEMFRRVNLGQEPGQKQDPELDPELGHQGKGALIAGGEKRNVDERESA